MKSAFGGLLVAVLLSSPERSPGARRARPDGSPIRTSGSPSCTTTCRTRRRGCRPWPAVCRDRRRLFATTTSALSRDRHLLARPLRIAHRAHERRQRCRHRLIPPSFWSRANAAVPRQRARRAADRRAAVERLDGVIQAYADVLRKDPGSADAAYNYEFVREAARHASPRRRRRAGTRRDRKAARHADSGLDRRSARRARRFTAVLAARPKAPT